MDIQLNYNNLEPHDDEMIYACNGCANTSFSLMRDTEGCSYLVCNNCNGYMEDVTVLYF